MSISKDGKKYDELRNGTLDSSGFIEYFDKLVEVVKKKFKVDDSYALSNIYSLLKYF